MKNKISGYLLAICMGAVVASGVHFFMRKNDFEEKSILIVLILYTVLLLLSAFIWYFFERDTDQTEALKTAQGELVAELNKIIGGHGEKLKQSLKQGTDSLTYAMRQYNDRAQDYHDRLTALKGLIRYHVYAAAIKSLHQSRDAEKAEKFVFRELNILEKIGAGENVSELAGGRAHVEEQAFNTLLGRVRNGALEPKTAFYKCKNCGGELEACPFCSGELERRFKK